MISRMNSTILKLAALCSPLLMTAATPALAGFDPAVVPAEAQWVFYLDVNALRTSPLGTEMLALVPKVDLDSSGLAVKVNVPKLIESISSATAYGTRFSEDPKEIDGALVIRGTDDLRKIVQGYLVASAAADDGKSEVKVKELNGLGFEAYQLQDEVIVALPPGNAILVSKSRESLAAARALLANDKGSMARAKNAVLAPLIPKSDQTYLVAASLVPRESKLIPDDGPQARILQMASAASLAIGQDAAMTTARIQIDATSAEMGDKLVKILQGLVAMLSFAETDDAGLAAFLKSVTVEKTPSGALLNLAYPTDRLAQMMKTIAEEHQNEGSGGGDADHPRPAKPAPVEGRVVAEWTADQDLDSDRPTSANIVTRTVEGVVLNTGDMIWLNGNRHAGEHARFDYVDIAPANKASASVRFEAENMRLTGYAPEEVGFASGGELIKLNNGSGSARFAFPNASGTYTLTIAYVDENDGQCPMSLSITEAKSQPGPEAPKP